MKQVKKGLVLGLATLGCLASASPAEAQVAAQHLRQIWNDAVEESSRLSQCRTTQEEIASDTVLSLAGKSDTYVRNCLKRTVRNKLIDRWRKASREVLFGCLGEEGADPLLESRTTPDEGVCEAVGIGEFKATLTLEELEVLAGLEGDGTEREIAQDLGVPRHRVRTLKKRISRKAARYFGIEGA